MIIDTEVKILVSKYHEHDTIVNAIIIVRLYWSLYSSMNLLHNIFTTGATYIVQFK